MEFREIITVIGFFLSLIWLGFYAGMEGKKKTYVIYIGIIIDIMLFAISRNTSLLLAGVVLGIVTGLSKAGANKLLTKVVHGEAEYRMQGWKNWVILGVVWVVMFLMVISIEIMMQQ